MRVYVILNNYILFLVSFTLLINFVIVLQSLSLVRLFVTPWTATRQASLSIIISQGLFRFKSIKSMMPSNHLILCCPFVLLPSLFPSIRVFSSELSLCVRWPKYWIFSPSIGPSNEYSGLLSFKIDGIDLLAIQGTCKSLPQHPSLKASVLWCSAFFMVHYSHPYMTTGKTITLAIQTFVSKVVSLHFDTLSKFLTKLKQNLKIPNNNCDFGEDFRVL